MWVTMMATKDDDDGGGEGGDCGGGIRNSQRISFIGPAARPRRREDKFRTRPRGLQKRSSRTSLSRVLSSLLFKMPPCIPAKMFRFTSLSASTGGRRARRRRPWKLRAPSGCTFAG